jgi:hypothetical protein
MTVATCGCGALVSGDCLCAATPVARLLGRRYVLGLLSLLAHRGTVRGELQSRLGSVSSSTLAARLAELEESGPGRRPERRPPPPGRPGRGQPMSGFRTVSPGNRPKSRSAVHSSRTPWSRHKAATRASCTCPPATRPASSTARSSRQ